MKETMENIIIKKIHNFADQDCSLEMFRCSDMSVTFMVYFLKGYYFLLTFSFLHCPL